MSELSSKARALVQNGRAGYRPNGEDRQRVLAGLQARLAPPVPAPVPRGLWIAASAALIGAGVAAGIALSSKPDVVVPPAPVRAPIAAPSAVLLPVAEPAVVTSVEAPPAVPSSAGPARRPADRLAEEVALLSQAAKDLRAGRAAEALRALNEHRRRFPAGALSLERRAARAEALCSLGRFAEADTELDALTQSSPSSPLTIRAKRRCAQR